MLYVRLISLTISVRPFVSTRDEPTQRFMFIFFSFLHAQAQCEGNGCVAAVARPHLGVRVYGDGQEYHLFPLYFRHRQLVAGIFFQILLMPSIRVLKPPFPFFFQSAGGLKDTFSNNSR